LNQRVYHNTLLHQSMTSILRALYISLLSPYHWPLLVISWLSHVPIYETKSFFPFCERWRLQFDSCILLPPPISGLTSRRGKKDPFHCSKTIMMTYRRSGDICYQKACLWLGVVSRLLVATFVGIYIPILGLSWRVLLSCLISLNFRVVLVGRLGIFFCHIHLVLIIDRKMMYMLH